MQALDVCFRALLGPGDGVLFPAPGYFIGGLVTRAGGTVQPFRSLPGSGFQPDWEHAAASVQQNTKMIFLNSPVNPTGYIYSVDDLTAAMRIAERHNLWVISDESYSKFIYREGRHLSPLSIDQTGSRTIVVRSFSKDFAMSGWRLGYIAAPLHLVERIADALEWMILCVDRAAQAVGLAALTGSQDWIATFVSRSERLGELAWKLLNDCPALSCPAPQGGLNLFVRFDADANELVRDVVYRQAVPIHPGSAFGLDGYFRFQFGATEEVISEATRRVIDTADHLLSVPSV
jgi:aspartate/methionine/tyrosine aminotransferase